MLNAEIVVDDCEAEETAPPFIHFSVPVPSAVMEFCAVLQGLGAVVPEIPVSMGNCSFPFESIILVPGAVYEARYPDEIGDRADVIPAVNVRCRGDFRNRCAPLY